MENIDVSNDPQRDKSEISKHDSSIISPADIIKIKTDIANKKFTMRSKKGTNEEDKKDSGPIHSKNLLKRALLQMKYRAEQSK
jgi:hypothetical protein